MFLDTKLILRVAALLVLVVAGLPALADPLSDREVQIAAKTLSFLKTDRVSGQTIGVFGNAADLDAVQRAFPDALVTTETDAENLSIAFVNDLNSAQKIDRGVLTITSDIECVDTGMCVLGVGVNPKVRIYLNRAAAESAGAVFEPSLMMLLTLRGGE